MNEEKPVRPVLRKEEARHILQYMTYRAREMMVRAGRFVDGLKAAGVEFSVGVPVKVPCGCSFGIPDVARPPRPCRKGEGALATSCLATTFCINELYQSR